MRLKYMSRRDSRREEVGSQDEQEGLRSRRVCDATESEARGEERAIASSSARCSDRRTRAVENNGGVRMH